MASDHAGACGFVRQECGDCRRDAFDALSFHHLCSSESFRRPAPHSSPDFRESDTTKEGLDIDRRCSATCPLIRECRCMGYAEVSSRGNLLRWHLFFGDDTQWSVSFGLDQWFEYRKSNKLDLELAKILNTIQIDNNERRFPAKRKIDEFLGSIRREEKTYL